MPWEHYETEALTARVTFARARRGRGALSNSAIVDLGDETLLFDTSLTPFAAVELRRIAEGATGRAPDVAVNSHWHLDHLLGNQVFEPIPIVATGRTREILRERAGTLSAEVSTESLARDVRRLEAMVASATEPRSKAYLEGVLELNRWVLRAAPELRLTPPNRSFDGHLALGGRRGVELLSLGGGHTESDAFLHLAEDGVVCAGDLVVVGTHPNLTDGDPEHWIEILRELDRLQPERIVPGHGPLGDREDIAALCDYLEALLTLAASGNDAPGIPARFQEWEEAGQFDENLKSLRTRASREGPTLTSGAPPGKAGAGRHAGGPTPSHRV